MINAAQQASPETREQTNWPVKLDKLSRDMNLQKQEEVKCRDEIQKTWEGPFVAKENVCCW